LELLSVSARWNSETVQRSVLQGILVLRRDILCMQQGEGVLANSENFAHLGKNRWIKIRPAVTLTFHDRFPRKRTTLLVGLPSTMAATKLPHASSAARFSSAKLCF